MSWVFISYGHADGTDFAQRLCQDLRRSGQEVWWDEEGIRAGARWDARIERAISQARVLLAVLTPHSVREDSVCRDEVEFALLLARPVIPARVSVEARPSLRLVRKSWIDFSADYDEGLRRLLVYLREGAEDALLPNGFSRLGTLKPLDFSRRLAELSWGFTGRGWIVDELDGWIASSRTKACVLVGDPGVGKSAIVAWLTRVADHRIAAVHFCESQDARTLDPHQFVASLVSQLHGRLPAYAALLRDTAAFSLGDPASQAFLELVAEPAHKLEPPAEPQLMLVDALDEAAGGNGETILEILAAHARSLPEWLRVVATARPDPRILAELQAWKRFDLAADRPDNVADLREYVRVQARERTAGWAAAADCRDSDYLAQQIERVSAGNFLVARLLIETLAEGEQSLQRLRELPPGLQSFHHELFARSLRDLSEFDEHYCLLLGVVSVARQALSLQALAAILGRSERELNRQLRALGPLIRDREDGLSLFHKSAADWLLDRSQAGAYWCNPAEGHRALADYGWRAFESGVDGMPSYVLLYLPLHLAAVQQWERLTQLLCSEAYVVARTKTDAASQDGLVASYAEALTLLGDPLRRRIWDAPEPCVRIALRGLARLVDHGRLDVARPLVGELGAVLAGRELSQPQLASLWHCLRGRLAVYDGQQQDAEQALTAALRIARQCAFEEGASKALLTLGVLFRSLARPSQEAIEVLGEALDSPYAARDPGFRARVLLNLAMARLRHGEVSEALARLEAAGAAAGSSTLLQAWCAKYLGFARLVSGERTTALDRFEVASRLFAEAGHPAESERCEALRVYCAGPEILVHLEDRLRAVEQRRRAMGSRVEPWGAQEAAAALGKAQAMLSGQGNPIPTENEMRDVAVVIAGAMRELEHAFDPEPPAFSALIRR